MGNPISQELRDAWTELDQARAKWYQSFRSEIRAHKRQGMEFDPALKLALGALHSRLAPHYERVMTAQGCCPLGDSAETL